LQRLGQGGTNIEELADKLGFTKADDLYIAAGRNELNMRQFQVAVRGTDMPVEERVMGEPRRRKAPEADRGILIVGVDKLLTQLARCCKPAPPDEIQGFVTRGKGVSIHRTDCTNFTQMTEEGQHSSLDVSEYQDVSDPSKTFETQDVC
jgi:GTP pyrophosphokinase